MLFRPEEMSSMGLNNVMAEMNILSSVAMGTAAAWFSALHHPHHVEI